MTELFPGPGHAFGPGYDAKASVALCMQEAANSMRAYNGKTMPTVDVAAHIENTKMWVASAQVHATALLALATEAQLALKQPKTCRCIRD